MDISTASEFLTYFCKVHERTMTAVRAIPHERIDWTFAPGRFTLGDLVRHIATANRFIFVETARGRPSAYAGCGKELAATYEDIIRLVARLHKENVEILSAFGPDDWNGKCVTPDAASITVWKWLRLMIEHEIHHRGQIYTYLAILEAPRPLLYGLTSEQVREKSVPDTKGAE